MYEQLSIKQQTGSYCYNWQDTKFPIHVGLSVDKGFKHLGKYQALSVYIIVFMLHAH